VFGIQGFELTSNTVQDDLFALQVSAVHCAVCNKRLCKLFLQKKYFVRTRLNFFHFSNVFVLFLTNVKRFTVKNDGD